jgi:hypothetical protein
MRLAQESENFKWSFSTTRLLYTAGGKNLLSLQRMIQCREHVGVQHNAKPWLQAALTGPKFALRYQLQTREL